MNKNYKKTYTDIYLTNDSITEPFKKTVIDLDNVKDHIVFKLVNSQQNKERLENIPHRQFHDLSIIYLIAVIEDRDNFYNRLVDNYITEVLGLNEEQLFELALDNTKKLFPPSVENINVVIRNILSDYDIPLDIINETFSDMPQQPPMWVISNEYIKNGAASILYKELLHELSEKSETDLYIIFSSIHEVIIVSISNNDPYYLAQTVKEINNEAVSLEERLSDHIYHYDRNSQNISLIAE